jgi:hypothetical protein
MSCSAGGVAVGPQVAVTETENGWVSRRPCGAEEEHRRWENAGGSVAGVGSPSPTGCSCVLGKGVRRESETGLATGCSSYHDHGGAGEGWETSSRGVRPAVGEGSESLGT